ncbi:hypothetical protein P3911_004470 [Salmonella enterica]|nr:hypothetical protein [Salmonella enterica]
MKKFIATVIAAAVLSGCVHSEPNMTIQEYKPGDNDASCDMLRSYVSNAQREYDTAKQAHTDQIVSNVVYSVTGAFIIIPWFFIDTSDAHSADMRNANARIANLKVIQASKHCDLPPVAGGLTHG